MQEGKHERAATEFEDNAGSVTGGNLNEVSLARRSFLGRIARWSAGFSVFGLGVETWMQAVPRRSIISTAVASDGFGRNRQLHPFPSDDPFNMPLGANAWYAPASDPASSDVLSKSGGMNVNNGWSVPVYFASTSDPLVEFYDRRSSPRVQSYRADEDYNTSNSNSMLEHLMLDATPAVGSGWPDDWGDWHLVVMQGNEEVEVFKFLWDDNDPGTQRVGSTRIVRNRLDHYSFVTHPDRKGPNPLANRGGFRVSSNPGIAGLVRIHEVDPRYTDNPHIPHAIAVALQREFQLGWPQRGDPSSPLYNLGVVFPGKTFNYKDYSQGNCRLGMRWAMDPTIVTDEYLNAIPNKYTRAVVRALRDYGMICTEGTQGYNVLYGEQGIERNIVPDLQAWDQNGPDGVRMVRHMRRVAGRVGGSTIHAPDESHWQVWANNREGWGGGAPRVPYSRPLAPLSPAVPPQSPGSIQVTENARYGDTV